MQTIGIHEDWTATPPGRTPTKVIERYPKSGIGRCFTGSPIITVQDLRPKVLATLQPYLTAGTKKIYISIKTDITQTSAGSWNARYTELAVYIAQLKVQYNVDIIVIPWHEPEDNFSSGTAFVTYYNKVYDAVKAGSSAVKVKPCFLSYHWAPGTGGSIGGKTNTPGLWFTNLKMTDGVTVDVYSGRSFPLNQILMEHPGFSRWILYVPNTVRINLSERGFETPSSTNSTNRSSLRASTMRREFDWLLTSDPIAMRCDDYTIWSSPGAEKAAGLIMDAAAEAEIDRFLSLAFPTSPPPAPPEAPNPLDVQYQFGYNAGLADGLAEGRSQGFTEGRAEGLIVGRAAGLATGLATARRPATGTRIRFKP